MGINSHITRLPIEYVKGERGRKGAAMGVYETADERYLFRSNHNGGVADDWRSG